MRPRRRDEPAGPTEDRTTLQSGDRPARILYTAIELATNINSKVRLEARVNFEASLISERGGGGVKFRWGCYRRHPQGSVGLEYLESKCLISPPALVLLALLFDALCIPRNEMRGPVRSRGGGSMHHRES